MTISAERLGGADRSPRRQGELGYSPETAQALRAYLALRQKVEEAQKALTACKGWANFGLNYVYRDGNAALLAVKRDAEAALRRLLEPSVTSIPHGERCFCDNCIQERAREKRKAADRKKDADEYVKRRNKKE